MVVADERHRRGVLAALRASDFDWVRALARGQLIELDGDVILSTLMRDGLSRSLPDDATFRRVLGRAIDRTGYKTLYSGLRIYGQMVDVLAQAGNDKAAVRLEELWNDLARTHRFQLYCGYSLAAFQRAKDGAAFRRVCSAHSRVVPSESFNELCQLDEQARVIAGLQQRAHALDREAAERVRLERALGEEQERLREANRRKDEFISLLSHELRNPLAPILTSLDVMDVRGDPSSRREREIIRRQARHMAAIIENLLDVSHVASSKDPPRHGTVARPRVPKQTVIAPDSQQTTKEPTSPQRILVVDDNRDGAFTLAELLGRLGCEVKVAHDGPSALEIASAFLPAAAFVDIGLPGMDGYALATRLRELPQAKTLRLIAVTGYSQATDRAKGVLAGFDAYVIKPLSLDTVRSMLDGTIALVSR